MEDAISEFLAELSDKAREIILKEPGSDQHQVSG